MAGNKRELDVTQLMQTLLVVGFNESGKPVPKIIDGWSRTANGGRHLGSKDKQQRKQRDYY